MSSVQDAAECHDRGSEGKKLRCLAGMQAADERPAPGKDGAKPPEPPKAEDGEGRSAVRIDVHSISAIVV